MRILFKYIVWLLSVFFLIIYYLLGTTLGNINLGYLVEGYYSKKMENKIEVLSLNIEQYPFITAEVKINDRAKLSLRGSADSDNMDMNYHLRGDSFKWGKHNVLQPINLRGVMKGKRSALLVKGKGEIFHGKTNYSFVKKNSGVDALELLFNKISSTDLLEFLKYDIEIEGDVNVSMNFEHFSAFRKKGKAKITMKKARLPKILENIEVSLDAEIAYKDLLRDFSMDIHSDIGKLRVANGYYNKAASLIRAEYGLQIKELSDFEKLLGHKYHGELITAGNLKYEAEKLSLLGDSISYGGLLEYNYQNDYLEIAFNGVSLEKLLRQLSFPALLSSEVYGTASYDVEADIILVNTKLKATRFRRTKMTDKIYKVTGIDIRKDVYNNSIFTGGYKDKILSSFLQIDNGVNHLYLRDTRMNSKTNEITANFEVAIDGQEFLGEIEGTLDDPKVNIDMTKLIKYQINKKIENFFGTGRPLNKKNIKKELEKVNLKEIKQKTRAFLNDFFD